MFLKFLFFIFCLTLLPIQNQLKKWLNLDFLSAKHQIISKIVARYESAKANGKK